MTQTANFLSDRSIAIAVDGFLSRLPSINSSVPQGFVMSSSVVFFVIITQQVMMKYLV